MSEARIAKLEDFVIETRDRLARGETKVGLSALRGEMAGGLSGLRAELHAQCAAQTRWMIANSVATVGMVVAALKFLR
jgi:hypothetical protein